MNRTFTLAFAASVPLLGCSGAMVNRARPNADYNADTYACQIEATQTYPVVMQTKQVNGTTSQDCYSAGSQVYCNGTYTPPQEVSTGVDVNATNRALAQLSCLSAKGWHWESEPNVANEPQRKRMATNQLVQSSDRDPNHLGYVVGYDIAKVIERFASLLDNGPLIGGIDDGFSGRVVISSEDLAKLRASFNAQVSQGGAAIADHPQWTAHPVVPSITNLSPMRTQYSYMVGVDVAKREANVSEFIDVGTLKMALVDTLAGHPIISEEEAAARRRVLHDLLQARSKHQ